MPTYLLQWEAIGRAWAAGCTCYDLRGVHSASPRPEEPDYGVYDFKRKLGAELVSFIGEFDLVTHPRIHAAWRSLEQLVQGPAGWAIRLRTRLARNR